MLEALAEAVGRREQTRLWLAEVTAAQTGILHELFRLTLKVWGGKGTKVPEPMTLPRPGELTLPRRPDEDPPAAPMRPRDAFRALARARGRG